MKKIHLSILIMLLCAVTTIAQSYLSPSTSFKSLDVFSAYNAFSAFDIYDSLLYGNDGDTIRCLNINTGEEINKYGKPSNYTSWASFLTMSPDGAEIWAGFTNSGNIDDRIYSINVETGVWDLQARLSGNFDLEFLNDSILVSGLNSSDWTDPTSIFVLDTTGSDNHRKIIEMGGSSAGLATDKNGNVYYGTYFYYTTDPNAIYRWDSADVAAAMASLGADTLKLEDATKLTDLYTGAYDCEVDEGGNLLFNSNSYSSDKVLAVWNGISGDGYNFDTLAVATGGADWITMIKSQGDVMNPEDGNEVFVLAYGRPLAKVYRSKSPVITEAIGIITGHETDADVDIDLNTHFTDPDDTVTFSYEVIVNSDSLVAVASITGQNLIVDFISAGQANISVKAISNGQAVTEEFIVGVILEIAGNYIISDFEDLSLANNSYWDGSDGTGSFISGLVQFPNTYGAFGWSEWAYTNMADDSTADYNNQFSAITVAGVDTITSEGKNYAMAYIPTDWMTAETIPIHVNFADSASHEVQGLFVTNSSYAALSMEQGDPFAKKFGGDDGNDPDWYKLSVWGLLEGDETDTIDYYLSDFRFDDNSKDYIIKTWQWLELSSLGEVDSLMFNLSSSDVSAFDLPSITISASPVEFAVNDKVRSLSLILVLIKAVLELYITVLIIATSSLSGSLNTFVNEIDSFASFS